MARRRRPIGGATWVATANFLVGAAVACVAAVLAPLIEDGLPVPGLRAGTWGRLTALVVFLVLLFAAVLWRGRVHGRTGTLFYVRILDDAMDDLHRRALQVARRRRLSLRSVTRWVDLTARTNDAGVIDVASVCDQTAAALEMAVNTGGYDTGYTLAPNMLWPAALAVGAELPILDRLTLLEFDPSMPVPETRFDLPIVAADTTVAVAVDHERYEDAPSAGRVGLLLAFAKSAQGMSADGVFADWGVSEYYRLRPAWVSPDLAALDTNRFTADQLATLAACLPTEVARIKNSVGGRELVLAAAMPKTLAVALGWGLAQRPCRFFTGTHLLLYNHQSAKDQPAKAAFVPMRVHGSQPTTGPDKMVR